MLDDLLAAAVWILLFLGAPLFVFSLERVMP